VVETPRLYWVIFEDKPFMTVDNAIGSPYQDRSDVTWTNLRPTGPDIWAARSNDFRRELQPARFGQPQQPLITTPTDSRRRRAIATRPVLAAVPGPDGALYVVYANFNNAVAGADNRNTMLPGHHGRWRHFRCPRQGC